MKIDTVKQVVFNGIQNKKCLGNNIFNADIKANPPNVTVKTNGAFLAANRKPSVRFSTANRCWGRFSRGPVTPLACSRHEDSCQKTLWSSNHVQNNENFNRYLFAFCSQPEAASDVISSVAVEQVGVDISVKFGDSRSIRSLEIFEPLTLWWTNDGAGGRRSSHKRVA